MLNDEIPKPYKLASYITYAENQRIISMNNDLKKKIRKINLKDINNIDARTDLSELCAEIEETECSNSEKDVFFKKRLSDDLQRIASSNPKQMLINKLSLLKEVFNNALILRKDCKSDALHDEVFYLNILAMNAVKDTSLLLDTSHIDQELINQNTSALMMKCYEEDALFKYFDEYYEKISWVDNEDTYYSINNLCSLIVLCEI